MSMEVCKSLQQMQQNIAQFPIRMECTFSCIKYNNQNDYLLDYLL